MPRKRNPKLLAEIRRRPCLIEGCYQKAEVHHIFSKGAGGADEEWNLMPLCHHHHKVTELEIGLHFIGRSTFVEMHGLEEYMIERDWYQDEFDLEYDYRGAAKPKWKHLNAWR